MCTRSWPTKPEIDEMFTMAPPPASRMAGTAYFMPRNTPLAFTPISASQAAVLLMSGSKVPLMPALLTSRSSFPNAVTAVFTAFCHSDSLVTSSFTNRAWPPPAAIFSTTWRASNSRTSATTTRAPSRAKIVASLCPIPLAPPVISATFPASLISPSIEIDLPSRTTAGAADEDRHGRVEKDPFPHRGDGPARVRMEPSRSGEADACRVVRSTLPRRSSPVAPAPRAASIAERARRVHCGSTARGGGRTRRRYGDLCAGARRVSGRLDLEAGRGAAARRGASSDRSDARRLRPPPRPGAPGHHGRHARAGDREAPLLRGPRSRDARGNELRRDGDLQGRRAGPRADRAALLHRRAGAHVGRAGRRYREARGAQRHQRSHDGPHAGGRREAPLRRSRP